ncbi:MAG TPA: glycerate kinase [Candidatus Anoxymicrobiaceae bacterium]
MTGIGYYIYMRIVIAPDSFKGSLSAVEAARAMAEGVELADPDAEVVTIPMADGGEGTVAAIIESVDTAEERHASVAGPLPGRQVRAKWAYLPAGATLAEASDGEPGALLRRGEATAVIEMAQASGYELVPPEKRDPFATTTYGTGQLILEALDAGCRQVIVGMGGSATVDGGMGMASALGFRFIDSDGQELPPTGGSLSKVRAIDASGRDERLVSAHFIAATDVDNLLIGSDGAARVFGPQKGATPEQVEELERGLTNLGKLISARGIDVLDLPGAGAAGGLGAGLAAFCGASITSGARLIAALTGLREKVAGADLVLTGEGNYDSQTARGKAPAGVAGIAEQSGVPAVVLAGAVTGHHHDFPAFCILPGPMSLNQAVAEARPLLVAGTARLIRLLYLFGEQKR